MKKHSDDWYQRRLAKYFQEKWNYPLFYVEFYPDPASNMWKFYVPHKSVVVALTCDHKGVVTEKLTYMKEEAND